MKVHIGVYKNSGLIHSVVTTAASVQDFSPAAELLHGDKDVIYGNAGCQGIAQKLRWQTRQRNPGWQFDQANA
jgi:IS5 family transposase